MAHSVVGIDLGTAAIKVVVLEAGFRHLRLVTAIEHPVAAGDGSLHERQGSALRAALDQLPAEATVFMALPGDTLAVRVLDLPFSDPRKIEQVVGYELEGQIVHALQDVVFDHQVLKQPRGIGASVLAAAARTEEAALAMAALGVRGFEPRSLFVAPIVYQSLFAEERKAVPAEGEGTCRLLIDIGHRRTNICFLAAGETIWARTINRGGEILTAAIAQTFQCDLARAEEIKRTQGFVANHTAPAHTPAQIRMDGIVREALAPLMRDLRQTLASYRAHDRLPIEAVLLTGGGAQLAGLAQYLEDQLTIPVISYAFGLGEPDAEITLSGREGRFTLAAAIAWAGARGDKQIDLRRGALQYRASFSVLRQKAVHLAVLAAALLTCATIDGSMAMGRLNSQRDRLQAQLRTATQEVFGEPRMDAQAVTTLLRKGFREEMAPIPKATAFDLLDEMSRKLPSSERIKLDVHEIDIRAKKVLMKGTVDSAAAVDEIVARLKEMECFEDITKGAITEVSGGAKNFSLNIASKCP